MATISDSSSNSGLSRSVRSVESNESEVSEVEGNLQMVEPYQVEHEASDSPAESDTEAAGDDNSEDKERLHSRDWYESAYMAKITQVC